MNHLDDLDPIELPEAFAQALTIDASCEAVLVESTATSLPGGSTRQPSDGHDRRGSVALFRVGRAYLVEFVAADGQTRILGLAPADADAYLDRVTRDEQWTVLSLRGELSANRGGTEAAVER